MYAIKLQGPKGRMTVSHIDMNGNVSFGYNTKVYKSRAGAQQAVERVRAVGGLSSIALANNLTIYQCDINGWALKANMLTGLTKADHAVYAAGI